MASYGGRPPLFIWRRHPSMFRVACGSSEAFLGGRCEQPAQLARHLGPNRNSFTLSSSLRYSLPSKSYSWPLTTCALGGDENVVRERKGSHSSLHSFTVFPSSACVTISLPAPKQHAPPTGSSWCRRLGDRSSIGLSPIHIGLRDAVLPAATGLPNQLSVCAEC